MAVRFDAAGDRVTWTGTAPTPSSGLTITLWAYISVDRNDWSTMIRLHASGGATTTTNLATDSGGVLPCNFTAGGSSPGPQALPVGDWGRVALTVTGTTSTVYVALGAAGATQSQAGTVGSNAAVSPNSGYTLGGRSSGDSSEWYNGRLAHVRLWNTVLTQTEIEAEWASATPVRTANLFADYRLADATDLADHSGNGRTLSAGSSAVTTEDGPPITTTVTGTVAATLPALAVGAAGDATASGTSVVDLPTLGAALSGSATIAGQVAATLPSVDLAAAGGSTLAGQLGAALPALDTELAGTLLVTGTATATLPSPEAALAGTITAPVAGTLAALLPALTLASGRTGWPPAVAVAADRPLVTVNGPSEVPWIAVT